MQEPRYVSTALVSQALGVGVSTVKRWVDEGYLPAHKTAGGHRKILLADVLRLVRSQKLAYADLAILNVPRAAEPPSAETLVARFHSAVAEADRDRAQAVLTEAYDSGYTIEAIGDLVISPVMAQIGHEWETGKVDVFEEHRATQVCLAALHGLQARIESAALVDPPLAIGGGSEGDHYQLACLLVQMTLQETGWEAVNVGPNTPIASFRRALIDLRPSLLCISFSHLADPERFIQEYAELHRVAADQGVAIALGGRALDSELRARLPADLQADSLSQLAEFARALRTRRGRRAAERRD